jgi:hypothetical protein
MRCALVLSRAVSFPDSYPKDPQDRLIGATALVGNELVTHEKGDIYVQMAFWRGITHKKGV